MKERIKVFAKDENLHLDDFYQGFKEKLDQVHTFPTEYIFKFIVSSGQKDIAKLHAIFDKADATFSVRDSKNAKYSSVTIKTLVNDAIDVVIYYRQVASIEGILML
ncbi:MAG: DUF493 domain-containing protein [Bacteroides sp.]|nr:DUF493 domain-containing protein [Bacteroides sp.]